METPAMSVIPRAAIALENKDEWLCHLREKGYVVVSGAVGKEDVATAKDLFWQWLESLGSGIDRNNKETWKDQNWPGRLDIGFCTSHGGAQSSGSWYLRGLAGVQEAFSAVWDADDLITSMDTFILWRPFWDSAAEATWKPRGISIHVDQNPVKKPGFHCVQGMIPLVKVEPGVGGLHVIPGTHTDQVQEELRMKYPEQANVEADFCMLDKDDKHQGRDKLVLAEAGDLILWDSRLIHSGRVGEGLQEEIDDFARCAMTVTMVPRSKATNEVLEKRWEALEKGFALTHWPQEYICHSDDDTDGKNINFQFKSPQLHQHQKKVV